MIAYPILIAIMLCIMEPISVDIVIALLCMLLGIAWGLRVDYTHRND